MIERVRVLLPCASFFAAGRVFGGVLTLGMQVSLVFWPMAYRMARAASLEQAVDAKLNEFYAKYYVPPPVAVAVALPLPVFGMAVQKNDGNFGGARLRRSA